jgi:hypothetical protein
MAASMKFPEKTGLEESTHWRESIAMRFDSWGEISSSEEKLYADRLAPLQEGRSNFDVLYL